MGRSPGLKQNIKKLVELNLNFVPREDRVFTLDSSTSNDASDCNAIRDFYFPSDPTAVIGDANKIASLCAALGVVPQVRITPSLHIMHVCSAPPTTSAREQSHTHTR